MTRRGLLAAGAVAALAGAGLGWALRRQAQQPSHANDADPARVADVWGLRFENPAGGEVLLANLRGRPLLLNFWATWCPPCVEELPMLDRFQRDHRTAGWQVLGLAVDSAAPVREFLAKHPVGFTIGLAGMEGLALSRALGNTSGGLPFSVIFDARGQPMERKLGAVTWDELSTWDRRAR